MSSEKMLVRLKPYNPKRGFKVRRYIVSSARLRLDVDRGWYEVDAALALKLSQLRQESTDPDSPPLCDVCTREEAIALEEREKEAEERASARRPHSEVRVHSPTRRNAPDLTTRDLPKNQDEPPPSVAGSRARGASARKPRSEPPAPPPMLDPAGEDSDGDDEIAPIGRVTPPAEKATRRKKK